MTDQTMGHNMVTAVKNLLSQEQAVKRNKDGSIRKKPGS